MNKVVSSSSTGWGVKTRAMIMQVPNVAIVKVFVISFLANLASGIGLVAEWLFHGKNHIGFEWIIYYALFLICLVLVIFISFSILIIISTTTCSTQSSSSNQIADSVSSTNNNKEAQETDQINIGCRSLAINMIDNSEEKMLQPPPRIKRAVSYPSHGKIITSSCRTR
ncbi:unnamed protein product [Cochlearia groenlandica]